MLNTVIYTTLSKVSGRSIKIIFDYKYLIFSWPSLVFNTCFNLTWHTFNQINISFGWDSFPFFLQSFFKFIKILWMHKSFSKSPFKFMPQMFNRIKVRRLRRPIWENLNLFLYNPIHLTPISKYASNSTVRKVKDCHYAKFIFLLPNWVYAS